jgi:hypothetical protein
MRVHKGLSVMRERDGRRREGEERERRSALKKY